MNLHEKLAASHPKLQRGMVWCRSCGWSQSVGSAHALKHGWPKCCGHTMTVDAPGERDTEAGQASPKTGREAKAEA